MKCFNALTALAVCALMFLLPACKKDTPTPPPPPPPPPTATCSSDIYGYNGSPSVAYATVNYGKITPSSGTATTLQTFMATTYSNQGAYNTSDLCYYAFKITNSSYSNTLYRVHATSGVSALTNSTSATEVFDGLVFNNFNNKLYCFKGDTSGPRIAELSVGSTTFTANVVATDPNAGYHVTSSTVDPGTGNIYYEVITVSGSTFIYKIMKYPPSGTPTMLSSGSGELLGLRYNRTTAMLNAIRPNATTWASSSEFVSIDPATGTTTTLSTLPFGTNREFYSACIDCSSNRYIVTQSMVSTTNGTLHEIDAAGSVVHSDTTVGAFQGMAVKY